MDHHQIANIALDEVEWGILISSDAKRQNHGTVSVVLEDNAPGRQKEFVLYGAPLDCRREKDDMISRRREVRGMSKWRASG